MSAANTHPIPEPDSYPATPPPAGSWTTVEPPEGHLITYQSIYSVPPARTSYQPTAEQLARDEAQRRHLRRNVYLPAIIAAIIGLALLVLVIGLAFGVNTPATRSFIAGLSALVVILMSIPLIILMTVLPLAWLAYRLNRRQQRKLYPEFGPMAYRSRLQVLLWRLESLLDQTYVSAERGSEVLKRPLIKAHSSADFIKGIERGIRKNFTRSETHESK
ncbi:MAG: hypothetical protein R6X18_16255 [Chloroflexota bacterium]